MGCCSLKVGARVVNARAPRSTRYWFVLSQVLDPLNDNPILVWSHHFSLFVFYLISHIILVGFARGMITVTPDPPAKEAKKASAISQSCFRNKTASTHNWFADKKSIFCPIGEANSHRPSSTWLGLQMAEGCHRMLTRSIWSLPGTVLWRCERIGSPCQACNSNACRRLYT